MIGTALCRTLLGRGDEVVGLTRSPARARAESPALEWHAWEPTLERPTEVAFDGVDAVVNLAGEKINQRWTAESKSRIMESRRTATHNLVGTIAGLSTKPRALVNGSAIGFYGDRGDEELDESSPPGSGFDAEVVVAWEESAREVEAAGVRLSIVRTGHVLDPSGGLLGELLPPFKLGLGGPIAGGRQYTSWVHIDDEVGVLLKAIDDDRAAGVLNSTAPAPVTNREFSSALGRALGRPAILPLPGVALDVRFGREFGQVLRGGQRVLPRRTRELGYEFRFTDIDAAFADLLQPATAS